MTLFPIPERGLRKARDIASNTDYNSTVQLITAVTKELFNTLQINAYNMPPTILYKGYTTKDISEDIKPYIRAFFMSGLSDDDKNDDDVMSSLNLLIDDLVPAGTNLCLYTAKIHNGSVFWSYKNPIITGPHDKVHLYTDGYKININPFYLHEIYGRPIPSLLAAPRNFAAAGSLYIPSRIPYTTNTIHPDMKSMPDELVGLFMLYIINPRLVNLALGDLTSNAHRTTLRYSMEELGGMGSVFKIYFSIMQKYYINNKGLTTDKAIQEAFTDLIFYLIPVSREVMTTILNPISIVQSRIEQLSEAMRYIIGIEDKVNNTSIVSTIITEMS